MEGEAKGCGCWKGEGRLLVSEGRGKATGAGREGGEGRSCEGEKEGEKSSTKKKPRVAFAMEEDTHIISSWLDSLTDQIVGVGTDFGLEHAWRLLKDQSKWLEQFTKNFSKRMKISTSGAYSSSSNPETPVEADTPSPIIRPMGQKAAKRKSKEKRVGTSTNPVDLTGMKEAMRERNVVNVKLVALREKKLENEYYDILMKDTSTMSETQLKDHEAFCKIIQSKLGI
ncbi:hypothetical protein GYH30_025282 [Glycine max]|uniref:No apical meristem-associated C-terminal domain-containing protein n=2 Tax=Glycine subgen. Soja TaxID=1462606 RepID=A0A0R0IJK1_SOYBN|nr:hypothetical protein GYH30_025282 [Glycine max]RZB92386.1 hypothetical protein D0Y65_024401 [Glycine soja]